MRPQALPARRCLAAALAAMVCMLTMPTAHAHTPPAPLACTVHAPAQVVAGQPVPLRFTLANPGRKAVQVLAWGTPFEGWLAPFVTVWRDGVELAYQGAAVKRGDPERNEYLLIAAGRKRMVTVDLAQAFDLRSPGRYRVQPQMQLHDVAFTARRTARTRAQFTAQALACNVVEFEVRASAP
jgi:hypothetical protein